MNTSPRRPRLGLVLVLLLSCGLAVAVAWEPLRERRENARLKGELLHERQRLRALRGLVDTLHAQPRQPVPARPQTFSI